MAAICSANIGRCNDINIQLMNNADHTQQIISFCTGYGGLELGLGLAGLNFRTVCYVEIEAFAIANLVAKIQTDQMAPAPIWTDLKTFPSECFFGKVDGIIGGYPCQPFSYAGKKRGPKDHRHLWPHIKRTITIIRPRWVWFENVEGHLTLGLKDVMHDLGEMGYITTAGLFSAREVGASQRRKRLFILGYSEHNGLSGTQKREGIEASIRDNQNRQEHAGELEGTGIPPVLANTIEQGSQRPGHPEQTWRGESSTLFKNWPKDTWPAGPGQSQHDWEEPRTIKSRMGRTIDGFATRIDQLRLLGNGVVPQTAAKAWIELNKELTKST